MTSLKSAKKRRQQLHARDVRGLVAFCFYPLEEKMVNTSCFPSIFHVQTVFTPISKPDKHAELLICCFFVALLFYVHGKHLRSCRDGQLT